MKQDSVYVHLKKLTRHWLPFKLMEGSKSTPVSNGLPPLSRISYVLSKNKQTVFPYRAKLVRLSLVLRVPFCKNQTNFKFRGKGRKFDFAHILMVDSLGYDKNYSIVFLAKYLFISKKYANYQSPLKSSFDASFY